MTIAEQYTLDGGTRPVEAARAASRSLSDNQRDILRVIATHGSIRAVDAGVIVHRNRGHCGFGNRDSLGPDAIGCCAYASGDGGDAMRRLADKGLVVKVGRGLWGQA